MSPTTVAKPREQWQLTGNMRLFAVCGTVLLGIALLSIPQLFNVIGLPRLVITALGLTVYWLAFVARVPSRTEAFEVVVLAIGFWFVAPSVLWAWVWVRVGQPLSDHTLLILALAGIALIVVVALWIMPKVQMKGMAGLEAKDRFLAENEARRTLAQVLTGLGILITIYTAQENLRVSQTGQITDRYTKAVGQLADQNHLEVRLGGLFSLERISAESPTDHLAIMQLLATYAQQRLNLGAPATELQQIPELKRPSPDVQVIFDIFRRRSDELERLEAQKSLFLGLRNCDLRSVGSSQLHLERTDFSGSLMDGLRMPLARLNFSQFNRTSMIRVQLDLAQMKNTYFEEAWLDEANFTGSDFSGTRFRLVRMPKASLLGGTLHQVIFESSDLSGALFANAKLKNVTFADCDLKGAAFGTAFGLGQFDEVSFKNSKLDGTFVVGVDLSRATGLTQAQIDAAVGDATTVLPKGLTAPKKWPAKYKP